MKGVQATAATTDNSFFVAIEPREAIRSAAIFALLLIVAFANVVFLGESLVPGNNHNPLSPTPTPENYGRRSHPAAFFDSRGVYSYANIHDPGGSWWQGEPASELLQRSLARGEFPLWDPYIGGGTPSAASLTTAYFYPPSFLVALLGNAPWLKNLYTLVLFLAAGFFTYVFLRKHNVGVIGSRAAGIAFMFSGAVVQTAAEFVGQTVVGIPILLATTACLMHRPTWRRTMAAAFVYALVALASFPPVLVLAFSLVVIYAICVVFLGQGGAGRRVLVARFMIAVLISLGLVAFDYLPAAHAVLGANHVNRYYQHAGLGSLSRRHIFQLLAPTLVEGTPLYVSPVVQLPRPSSNLFYFGISGLLLAAATIGRVRPWPLLLLMQAMTALLLLKVFGISPVHALGKLPLLRTVHFSSYGGLLLAFLLACLTGMAVDLVLQQRLPLVSSAATSIAAAYALFRLWRIAHIESPGHPQFWRWEADYRIVLLLFAMTAGLMLLTHALRPGTVALRVVTVAIVALIAIEGVMNAVFVRQPQWNYWDHPPKYVRALEGRPTLGRVLPFGVLPANTNSPFSIGSTDSLLTFNSERYAELHHRYMGSADEILLRQCSVLPSDAVLDAFAVDHVLISVLKNSLIAEALARGFLSVYADESVVLFRRPSAPRYFLTRDYSVESRDEAFYDFASRRPRELLLEQRPSIPPDPSFPAGSEVRVEHFGLNSYRLRVFSPVEALLSASEVDFPGWTATVNGHGVPILLANYAFRAVEVPAGHSIVELSYWPPGMTAGIVISAVIFLIAIGIAAREWRARR